MTIQEIVDKVAPHLHAKEHLEAGLVLAGLLNIEAPTTPAEGIKACQSLLQMLLSRAELALAAKLLWPPSYFSPEPKSVRDIWDAMRSESFILFPGSASMGKTYTPGVLYLLEWLRDPEFTSVICVGPGEDHLESNLFSHLVNLHNEASVPLPGKVGKLFIGLNTRQRLSAIRGVVIPVGKKAAGKVQGFKRRQRKKPHPVFGKMTRMFILIDELENVPSGIYRDLENIMSARQSVDDTGFQVVCAWNPKDIGAKPAEMAEPAGAGWRGFDADKHFKWRSKKGWFVVRLDASQSENVVSGEVLFPGLQTKAGFDQIVVASGGIGSPGYWTFCRGCYPPQGSELSVMSESVVNAAVAEVIFVRTPMVVAGCDLALEGGDTAIYALGRYGLASGYRLPPAGGKPAEVVRFTAPNGQPLPREVLEIAALIPLPKGDSVQMAGGVQKLSQSLHVEPDGLILDRTGNGAGVHDILRQVWHSTVRGVNYSSSPTSTRIKEEDLLPADEAFPRVDSEMWFALRDWLQYHYAFIHPSVNLLGIIGQLVGRQYRTGAKDKVESKGDYKSRGNPSPNEADAMTLIVHCVRAKFAAVIIATASQWAARMREQLGQSVNRGDWWGSGGDVDRPIVDKANDISGQYLDD